MKRIILIVLSVIVGLLFINSGLNKFLNYLPVPDDLPQALLDDSNALLEIAWLLPLIGTAEIVGGALLFFPRTRALGTLILVPVAAGILLTHLTVAPDSLFIALVIWAVLIWIIVEDRRKFLPLVRA